MPNTRNWPVLSAHSMTIGGKHTFRDWYMVPEEIPVFQPPPVKQNRIDVPGMDGDLDLTEIFGDVSYGNRVGSISFVVLDDITWATAYSTVLNFLHGQRLNCILDDDPTFFYSGRFAVNKWKSEREYNRIVIDYILDPYKYTNTRTGSMDWLWNDLFNTTIYYGTFDVAGTKARNLINPSGSAVTPEITCSAAMTVTFGGHTYSLPAGKTTAPGFQLQPGDNQMTFTGTGRVLVDYAAGMQL